MDLMATAQLLGNFGEFVGAIAVVVTLFYLAYQVRQGKAALDANTLALNESRRMVGAQIYQQRAQMSQTQLNGYADSEYLAPIGVKLETKGWKALDDEERWRYEKLQLAVMTGVENLHYQYQQGFLDQELWDSTLRRAKPFVSFWKSIGIFQGRESFLADIEQGLTDIERSGD